MRSMLDRQVISSVWLLLMEVLWLPLSARPLAGNPADEHVKLELVSEQDAIVPDRQFWLGIRFDLEDGWHTYWINPGDSGEAPRIDWNLPAGFQVGSIQWPYPARLSTPPLADFGYEHQVLLPVVVRPPAGLTEGETEKIIANVNYLVCREVCIPGRKELVLAIPVKDHSSTAGPDLPLFEAAQQRLPRPLPERWKILVTSTGNEFRLSLRAGKLTANPQFFPLEAEQIENAAPQNVIEIPGGVQLHLKKSNQLLKPISRLKGVIVVSGAAYLVDVPVSQSSH
jgi:DsbC/DsbD-like thiol-disulfide interchange protein